jgi:hypothetical protein
VVSEQQLISIPRIGTKIHTYEPSEDFDGPTESLLGYDVVNFGRYQRRSVEGSTRLSCPSKQ